jgi:hypothetical protein
MKYILIIAPESRKQAYSELLYASTNITKRVAGSIQSIRTSDNLYTFCAPNKEHIQGYSSDLIVLDKSIDDADLLEFLSCSNLIRM